MRSSETYQKWVYVVLLCFAALAGFLVVSAVEYGIYQLHLHRKMRYIFVYNHLFGVGIALLTFVILVRQGKIYSYVEEVVAETIKISWPGKREVIATTLVVIVGVIIAGVVLGMFDYLFSLGMGWILTG